MSGDAGNFDAKGGDFRVLAGGFGDGVQDGLLFRREGTGIVAVSASVLVTGLATAAAPSMLG